MAFNETEFRNAMIKELQRQEFTDWMEYPQIWVALDMFDVSIPAETRKGWFASHGYSTPELEDRGIPVWD